MIPKVGDRVRLVRMGDDPDPVPPGSEGTVAFVSDLDGWQQVSVKWDSGRRLMLCLPEDQVEVLS